MENHELNRVQEIESCVEQLRLGTLTEQRLREAFGAVQAPTKRKQQLLYMQLQNTFPGSMALGVVIFRDGAVVEPPNDPKDWPYHTALAAIADGWRIISFPNPVLLADPVVPQGLGCEFILEKWV